MPTLVTARRNRLAALSAAAQSAPAASGEPLTLTSSRLWRLREPVSGRSYSVLRLETRSGLVGWGEGGEVTEKEAAAARDRVLGRPASSIEPVRLQLAAVPAMQAPVNIAMLDIVAKAAKVPLYQYLGGPTRARLRAFAPVEGDRLDQILAGVDRVRQAGFRAAGVPLAPPAPGVQRKAYVNSVHRQMDALRAHAGDGFDFILRANGQLIPMDAATVAAELERFHLMWLDEPCGLRHLDVLAKVSETVTPLGYGRQIRDMNRFMDLLRAQVIDVIRPSMAVYGITAARRLAAIAETYYTAVAPQHDGGPVGTAAALHLAGSLPNFYIQEIPLPAAERDRAMRAEVAGAGVEAVKDGFASLPQGAGLGVAVSERALDKYAEGRV